MNPNDLKKDIRIEDLSETMQQMADVIGIDKLILLIEHFGGDLVHISSLNSALRGARNRKIQSLLKQGKNYRDVATMFNLTTVAIRYIDCIKYKQKSLF